MCPTASSAAVALRAAQPADVETELLFVPMFEGENVTTAVTGLDEAAGGALGRASDSTEFQGRPYELFLSPLTGWRAPRVSLIGVGKAADFGSDRLRKSATAAALAARQRRVKRVAFLNRGGGEP